MECKIRKLKHFRITITVKYLKNSDSGTNASILRLRRKDKVSGMLEYWDHPEIQIHPYLKSSKTFDFSSLPPSTSLVEEVEEKQIDLLENYFTLSIKAILDIILIHIIPIKKIIIESLFFGWVLLTLNSK